MATLDTLLRPTRNLVGCLNRKHNTNPTRPLVCSRPFTPRHMNIRVRHRSVVFLAATLSIGAQPITAQAPLTVASPDSRTEVRFEIRDGHAMYSVTRDRRPLILPSLLGFEFRGAPPLRDSLRVTGSSRRSYDSTWTQPWGEVSRVRDHHNELRISLA